MTEQRFAIDRIEGRGDRATIIVVNDSTGASHEISASLLLAEARAEGAILVVPVRAGTPQWGAARRDHAEEDRRRSAHRTSLDALRRGDPGGDIVL